MEKDELERFDGLYKSKMAEYSATARERAIESISPVFVETAKTLRSIIAYLGNAKSGMSVVTGEQTGCRIWLHQIYNQGMLETEKLLFDGQYFKAAVCMKQDLETLSRVRQVKEGKLPHGDTPNVSYAPPGMGKAYGVLNDIGHVSRPAFYTFLNSHELDCKNNATPFPIFNKAMFVDSYVVYLWILLEMTRESIVLLRDMFPEDEALYMEVMEHYSGAQDILRENGFDFKEPDS